MIYKTGNGNLNFKKIKDTDILFIDGDRGKNYPSSNQIKNFGYCVFLDAKNITKNGFNIDKLNFITKEKDNVLRKGRLLPNDIIITTRGTLNNIALYSKEISKKIPNARINSGMVIMRLGEKYCPYFFEFFLRSSLWVKQCINSGGVIPQLTISKMVENYIIDVGIKEQQRIADVLSKQESIINKTKELINELDKRNTFMLDELLSGRLRIKDENGAITFYKNPEDNWQSVIMNGEEKQIPKDWFSSKIGDSIDIIFGKRIVKSESFGEIPVYGGGGVSFFNNVANNKNKWVISRFAMSKKCVRKVREDFWLLDSGFTFNTQNGNIENYFGYLFSSFQDFIYGRLSTGTAQKNIDIKAFKKVDISFPIPEEQKIIENLVLRLINEKEKYEELLIEEQKKFDFLLEELMSGRLRIEE